VLSNHTSTHLTYRGIFVVDYLKKIFYFILFIYLS
jgi:hypothetical protein